MYDMVYDTYKADILATEHRALNTRDASDLPRKRIIVGIAGRKGHGKDTAANGLLGFTNIKFAGALKDMTRAYMSYVGMSAATIERCIEGDMKQTPLVCFNGQTTRQFMQKLGTEFGRDLIYPDIWTDAFKSAVRNSAGDVVCTDVRYPNELDVLKSLGATTIRVVRPDLPPSADEHPSETSIDTLDVDFVVINNGTVLDLHKKIQDIVHFGGIRFQ